MRLLVGIALAGAAWAQSVGTASRAVSLPPDEIVVELVVVTAPDLTPDQVASHLAALSVDLNDLKTVGTLRDEPERLAWEFAFIRPYTQLNTTIKQLEFARAELRDRPGIAVRYQFFLRASPRSVAAMKQKVLTGLIADARRASGSNGKLRSVVFEPAAENIDSARSARVFGQASGALRFEFTVTAVFEND